MKKISNTADKLIIGCGTPGLDLRRTLTYARPDSLIMEYYVRPHVFIYRDGVKLLEDDIFARYRKTESVTKMLRDCAMGAKTPIIEQTNPKCSGAAVIGNNPVYENKIEPMPNRWVKYGWELPTSDPPDFPVGGIYYNLGSTILNIISPDYTSNEFTHLSPHVYKHSFRLFIYYTLKYTRVKMVKGPSVNIDEFKGGRVGVLALRDTRRIKPWLTSFTNVNNCKISAITGEVNIQSSEPSTKIFWDVVPEDQGNVGSDYIYIFYNPRSGAVGRINGMEYKVFPKAGTDETTLDKTITQTDSTCNLQITAVKSKDYQDGYYDMLKTYVLPKSSKLHEDFRSDDYQSVFQYITPENTCGDKQRANRCGTVNPVTDKVFSTVEFEVDKVDGNYTCIFAGDPSKNFYYEGVIPTTTTTTTTTTPAPTTTTTTTTTPAPTTTTTTTTTPVPTTTTTTPAPTTTTTTTTLAPTTTTPTTTTTTTIPTTTTPIILKPPTKNPLIIDQDKNVTSTTTPKELESNKDTIFVKIKDVVFSYKIKSTPDDHRRYRNYSQQEIPKINLDWLLLYMAALGGSLFVSFIIICSICIYIRKMK